MKNTIKILLFSIVFSFAFISCEDDEKASFQAIIGLENQAAYMRVLYTETTFDSSKLDESSVTFTFSNTGETVSSYSLSVTKTGLGGDPYPLDTFTSFPVTVTYTAAELASAMGITLDDIFPAEFIMFSGASTGPDGTVTTIDQLAGDLSGQAEQRNAYAFSILVSCPPVDPTPGTWRLELIDNYGDGWQGGFITAIVDDVETTHAMIDWWGPDSTGNLYEPPNTIVDDFVEVPAGTSFLRFNYTLNGDFASEVEFNIYDPSGALVGFDGPFPLEGEICIIR